MPLPERRAEGKARRRESAGQDNRDLRAARRGGKISEDKLALASIGPGIVTGAADDDPSGIGTFCVTGAQFGYLLLWLIPVSVPLMVAVQEMCGRIAAITGSGLAAVIKAHYPRRLLYFSVGLLVIANVFNVYADLNVMAASTQMLFRIPMWVGLIGFTAILVLAQVFISYRTYARVLKWLCLTLLAYVVVAFMPGMKIDWSQIALNFFVPHVNLGADAMLATVAFLGTTISPYLFFWQAGETVEEEIENHSANEPGKRTRAVTYREMRNIRADTAIGMIGSQLITFFIVIAAAGSLHRIGATGLNSAVDAAKALRPLGKAAYLFFSLGIVSTGLLAIPTMAGAVAYSLSETFDWRYGLYRPFSRARRFYLSIGAVVVVGCLMNFVGVISPIKGLVYAAALNGIVAPPLIVVLICICNNKSIMGSRCNGRWSNAFSVVTVLLMGPAAIYLICSMVAGRV